MGWIVKIFLFTNFLLPKGTTTDIYTFHEQVCHLFWAEDFTFELELKPIKHSIFQGVYRTQGQVIQKHIMTLYPEIIRKAAILFF